MNAAEAKKILSEADPLTQGWDIADARAYLEALQGEEVAALVEALEHYASPRKTGSLLQISGKLAEKTLSKFKKIHGEK